MPTTPPGLQPALTLLATVAALALAAPAHATTRHDNLPLHGGSSGPRVAKIQYLIRDPRPRQNPFTLIKGTFPHQPNGYFGARTKSAVVKYKWRFGFPQKGQCGAPVNLVIPTVGQHFFDLLDRHATRPACWVALAASRLKAIVPGPTALAVKAKSYELELLAASIHEIPDGSNRGPAISYTAALAGHTIRALQSSTGAYGQAWCVSTQQAVMKAIGYGTFANATAGVYYTVDYYAARNQLVAKARVGELVAFITYDRYGHRVPGTGHMGFVMAVQASTFTYAAGNDGNAFREHTIPMGSRPYAFIALRGLA
jgi:peptidoglycan hydrolase-like protein with peptidoglycan-binding domain